VDACFRAALHASWVTGRGRSATDLFIQTRHSARLARDRRHPANYDPHYRRGFAKAPLNAVSTDEFDPLETLTRFMVFMEILHYLTQLG
jgi:hypothetical protein